MSEILQHGKFYQNPPPEFWWIGRGMKCEKCGCKFKLQYKDKPEYNGNSLPLNSQFNVSCPECGSVETIESKETKLANKRADDTYLAW